VEGGDFYRSYDGVSYTDKGYPATVSTFFLDKYEVTVGRFRAFVESGMGTQANPPAAGAGAGIAPGTGWDWTWNSDLEVDTFMLKSGLAYDSLYGTWTVKVGSNENLPINCVTWHEAFAFCAWDGGRLPTEAEWNYAAAGGSEQRVYPWGPTEPDTSLTVFSCLGDGVSGCTLADRLAVGSKPLGNGKWGQSDLAGSMCEWVFDWNGTYSNDCQNCVNGTSDPNRVYRGGSFNQIASALKAAYRTGRAPGNRYMEIGLRCARSEP